MKKIMIASIFCALLFICSTIPAIGIDIPKEELNDNDFINKYLEISKKSETFGNYTIYTIGPVSKSYTNIELIDGIESQIKPIEKNLNREFPRISMILPCIFIIAKNLDFTFEYIQEIEEGSRYSYGTTWGEAVYDDEGNFLNITNETLILNKIHKIQVTDFTGVFIFMRMRIRKAFLIPSPQTWFIPARFAFIGFCEDIKEII